MNDHRHPLDAHRTRLTDCLTLISCFFATFSRFFMKILPLSAGESGWKHPVWPI
jgi:hypothetical protein